MCFKVKHYVFNVLNKFTNINVLVKEKIKLGYCKNN